MLRVGIVGAGLRGRLFAGALHRQAEIVGLAEPSNAAREAARSAGYRTYADHRELLDGQRPDAVIVATPDFAHRDAAVDAASAGAHLLVEKPLATTMADARAIADAVTAAGVCCMMGFENRWNPHFVQIRQRIDDGRLHRPVSQSMTLSNTFYVPTRMLSWSAASSVVWFLMPHAVDLTSWLADATPVSVFARGSRGVLDARGIHTWDVVHVSLSLADGGLADITSAWILPESSPTIADARYEAVTGAGTARVDLGDQGLAIVDDGYQRPAPLGDEIDGEPVGMATWMARRFVRDLESGTRTAPGLDEGLRVTATLAAVDESLRHERPVRVDEIADIGSSTP